MSTTSPEGLATLARLAKKYRIEFSSELSRERFPERYHSVLDHVSQLGEAKFATYAVDEDQTHDKPWKLEAKSQAKALYERAKLCTQRNESSWRGACEHLIFARMTAEVACGKCRNRLWRSEIEAEPYDDASTSSRALRRRQQAREPCRCPRSERLQDQLEAVGTRQIFGHREDEVVRLDPDISKDLSKSFQKPDKVFGLRQTRNIENLLNDTVKIHHDEDGAWGPKLVHEILSAPLDQTGDALLFPFLVLEAKSGKGAYDWHSIQMQTAFPIRRFLEAQLELRTASSGLEAPLFHGSLEPLVWFLCNKGEDWRLSLAFTQEGAETVGTHGKIDYKVVDVWRGSINTLDGALQLLLLVSYIFDWARDVYRENIMSRLRRLASGENDAATVLCADSEIFSTIQNLERELTNLDVDKNLDLYQSYEQKYVNVSRSDDILFRHANYVESRYCCLFITPDNIKTLLDSTSGTPNERLCGIIGSLLYSFWIDLETIGAMEAQWTRNSRLLATPRTLNTKFRAVISCTTYLATDWRIIRELYAVAIDENAWGRVLELMESSPRGEPRQTSKDALLVLLQQLQAGSPSEVLLNAIKRRCLVFPNHGRYIMDETLHKNSVIQPLGNFHHNAGNLRQGIHDIYQSFKKGILEPQEPFLKVSKRPGIQDTFIGPVKCAAPLHSWEFEHDGPLTVPIERFVWVHASGPEMTESSTKMCLYLVAKAIIFPKMDQLQYHAKKAIESQDVYHTVQSGLAQWKWKAIAKEPQWNLREPYGLCYQDLKDLPKAISNARNPRDNALCLGSTNMTCSSSGQFLFKRNMDPLKDPWLKRILSAEDLFFRYNVTKQDITFWKFMSKKRRSMGLKCCHICAYRGQDVICGMCKSYAFSSGQEIWLRHAMLDVHGELLDREFPNERFRKEEPGIKLYTNEDSEISEFWDLIRRYLLLTGRRPLAEGVRGLQKQHRHFEDWLRQQVPEQATKRRRLA